MDNMEGTRDVRPDQRIDQFMRLRDVIEERASRKFFEEQVQADRVAKLFLQPERATPFQR
jgi:hypothetical protein